MQFGPTLRLLRTDAGMSLRALAREVGVSCAYLSRVENGHDPPPTPDRLAAIAGALQLCPEVLVELANQTAPALSAYVAREPAAHAFFLEIARRNLEADQLARLHQLLDAEFPDPSATASAVRLSQLIGRARVVLGFAGTTLGEIIAAGVARCAATARDLDADAVAASICAREARAPTLLGNGVAVPHAIVDGATTTAALLTLSTPLSLAAPDGEPVEVVVVLVSGAGGREHLNTLAQVALIASRHVAPALRRARSAAQVLSIVDRLETSA